MWTLLSIFWNLPVSYDGPFPSVHEEI